MIRKTLPLLATLLAALGTATPVLADGKDDAMLNLATNAGCLTCHHVDPGGKGPDGLAPIGPAWREVSAKYKGQKDAVAKLTHTAKKLVQWIVGLEAVKKP